MPSELAVPFGWIKYWFVTRLMGAENNSDAMENVPVITMQVVIPLSFT